jgi:hypothetical protein
MIIDDQFVILSTENLSPESFPDDDKVDGTWGRRGLLLKTPAGGVVQYFSELWNYDFDPENHLDLMRWSMDHPVYGAPIPGTVPMTSTVGSGYTVRYQHPVTFTGSFHFEMIQSPANSLASDYGLLGLINRAGDGDEIYAQELYELTYWGDSGSNPISDPNPRLESMIEAARRGTSVHLLLDGFFDDPEASRSNWGTCKYVQAAAQEERLDIYCVLGNPSGLGIHNKMILFELDGVGYVHMGSLNGSEVSSKGNREIAIQIESDSAFEYLRRMYFGDWPGIGRLPIIFGDYQGRADYVLISEVLYDSSGPDLAEFIEIANPTNSPIDISSYSIGDALSRDDYEDVRRFPSNTILTGGDALVVANTATGFYSLFGYFPDFEIRDSHPLVSNLIDDPTWGAPGAYVQLSNQGDEVILRNAEDEIVDAIGYGSGYVPGVISCPLVQISNYSLERYPFWMDTNDCGKDFRSQSDPTPGTLP